LADGLQKVASKLDNATDLKALLGDLSENDNFAKEFLGKVGKNEGLVDSWQSLKSVKPDLCKDLPVLESFNLLSKNIKRMMFPEITDNMIAAIKSSEGSSYKSIIDNLNELFSNFPTDASKVKQLEQFIGTKGFNMAGEAYWIWRHSAVQLQRILENKDILKNADEIIFESEVATTMGRSFTDLRIVRADKSIIEIETKAGMEFFEGIGSSNFITQSSNSLEAVSKIEDYKVFLNPKKIAEFANPDLLKAAKDKIVKGWKEGGLLNNQIIYNNFLDYNNRVTKNTNFRRIADFEDFLLNTKNWFEEIFMKNL